MKSLRQLFWPAFENALPWVTLALISFYAYGLFFMRPYTGVIVNLSSQGWVVNDVDQGSPLQVGDILTGVGPVSGAEAERDLNQGFFNSAHDGETLDIALERGGWPLTFSYTLPGFSSNEMFGRLNSQWFIPYIFWLAGCAALLFLRPRGLQRRLLALFFFLNAAWVSTGSVSGIHFMGAALALRALVWLSVPVYLHLHWLFPRPLRALPGWVWGIVYALCAALAVASVFQLLPQNLFLFGFILAVLGSLGLLLTHLVCQPDERRALGGMAIAFGFILLPVVVMVGLTIVRVDVLYSGIAALGLVALPGFYFFTLYIRQLTPAQARQAARLVRAYFFLVVGGLLFCLAFSVYAGFQIPSVYFTGRTTGIPLILLVIALLSFVPFLVLPALGDERITLRLGASAFGFSANRAAAAVIFLILEVLGGLSLLLLVRLIRVPGADLLSILAALLACALLGLFGFQPFQRFFERRVLGMTLAPESLLTTYAARITTSLDLDTLHSLLVDEVLPSLLVRQFAQLGWRDGVLTPVFTLRVSPGEAPAPDVQPILAGVCGVFLPPTSPLALPGWVRLVLPLYAAGRLRGYWLLGQRDPDDRYSPDEIAMLQALADQTALSLVNIDQAAALRALYFEDMERHEGERLHLAAELHDDVLNQLGILNLNLQETTPVIRAAYDQAVGHVREIINGLRPAMLNFGLFAALESLVDELNDRYPNGPQVALEVPSPREETRYPARVELALFRMVQQACGNAIQHARCDRILIQGSLDECTARLTVSDDGCGFASAAVADLPAMLAGKHFGLAGMYERAALIGAVLRIHSTPGKGVQVEITWQS